MQSKLILFAIVLILMGLSHSAWSILLTGNVDNDFVGPGVQSHPDEVGDEKGPFGCMDEPLGSNAFEIPPPMQMIPASGFNIERITSFYDAMSDILYIGLDVCDERIAWDADGDGSMTSVATPGLRSVFTDSLFEAYMIWLDMDRNGVPEVNVRVYSIDGGTTIITDTAGGPPGVTADPAISGADVEIAVHGLHTSFPLSSAVRMTTMCGAFGDLSSEDITTHDVLLPMPGLEFAAEVGTSMEGPFAPSIVVIPGADAYLRIRIINTGNELLEDVTLEGTAGDNSGCAVIMPEVMIIGSVGPGEERNFLFPIQTRPEATPGTCCIITATINARAAISEKQLSTQSQAAVCFPQDLTIGEAREQNFGSPVMIRSKTVTAGFGDASYIEELDRSAGIRIEEPGFPEGAVISVAGELALIGNEKSIVPQSLRLEGLNQPVPEALGMAIRSAGGRGINTLGMDSTGLLVRTWGLVCAHDPEPPNSFRIYDGSVTLTKPRFPMQALVVCPEDVELPELGEYVSVTGICCPNLVPGGPARIIIRVRRADDVVKLATH